MTLAEDAAVEGSQEAAERADRGLPQEAQQVFHGLLGQSGGELRGLESLDVFYGDVGQRALFRGEGPGIKEA